MIELMEIPSAGGPVIMPDVLFRPGKSGAGLRSLRPLLGPDVIIAIDALFASAAALEPRMLIRSVMDDEVDDHFQSPPVRRVQEFLKIFRRAASGVYSIIVGNV